MAFLKNLFSKNSIDVSDFSFLGTDMHSHLIPGVDDGSPDIDTSLQFIAQLKELGYKKLITTPHIFQEYYPNTPEILNAGEAIVKKAITENNIDIEFKVAAEYYLDLYVMDLLEKDIPLLTLSGNKVLVEFPMVTEPLHRDELLFKLQLKGYDPVIAHVERYVYYHNKFDQYKQLYEMGLSLQVNILSFTGIYGKHIKKAAFQLLEKGYVKYLGTDLHHYEHVLALQRLQQNHQLMRKLSAYTWRNSEL